MLNQRQVIILFVLIVFALLCVRPAHAYTYGATGAYCWTSGNATPQAACDDHQSCYGYPAATFVAGTAYGSVGACMAGTGNYGYVFRYGVPLVCTSPQVLSADGYSCVDPPPDVCAGLQGAIRSVQSVGDPPASACFAGCSYAQTGTAVTLVLSNEGFAKYIATGTSCSPDSTGLTASNPTAPPPAGIDCVANPTLDACKPAADLTCMYNFALSKTDPACVPPSQKSPTCASGQVLDSTGANCVTPTASTAPGATTPTKTDVIGNVPQPDGTVASGVVGTRTENVTSGPFDPVGMLGNVPQAEGVPRSIPAFSYNPVVFNSSLTCPAPIVFNITGLPFISRQYSFSYDQLCNIAGSLRPIFLTLASITAAFIFASALTL